MNPPSPANDEAARLARELREVSKRLALAESQCLALEEQVRGSDDLLQETREKLRAAKKKATQAERYRALLHQLRSRWYLRPFIRASDLAPPVENVDSWVYRGPRFDTVAGAHAASARRRVLVVGHLMGTQLFGSERSLLDIIAAIDPDQFDVFAVFPERNEQVFAQLKPLLQGIAVLDYSWWRTDRPFREETVRAFTEIYQQVGIELVHANTIMLADPLVAARRVGIPAITNARELISLDLDLAVRLGGSPDHVACAVCENASYLLANSAATLADYPCGGRGSYLYNSVDAEEFDLPNAVDPNCIKVGLVSSNLLKKGIADFVELARQAETHVPSLQFHLIGPENHLIKEWRAGGAQLPANLHIRGHISHPSEAYRDLNLVLNLSHFAESFGRTVAEAMMARRPVIAYRHGALPELIDDGETGFLVPYLDLPAILDRLAFFAENPAKITEFGEKARERNRKRFSRETLSRGINTLYERLIAEARQNR